MIGFRVLIGLSLMALVGAGPALGQDVRFAPDATATLQARWDWSMRQPGVTSIAWAIHGTAASWPGMSNQQSLAQVVDRESGDSNRMAVVLKVQSGAVVRVNSQPMHQTSGIDLHGLVWLGDAPQSESFALIDRLFSELGRSASSGTTGSTKCWVVCGLVHAMGVHKEMLAASTWLTDVLRDHPLVEARKSAAFALADHSGEAALEILVRVAGENPDEDLASAAAFAIGNVGSPKSVSALQKVLRVSKRREVRKAAVFALGNMDAPSAREALIQLIETEGDQPG